MARIRYTLRDLCVLAWRRLLLAAVKKNYLFFALGWALS
jgi:hypothetical protein